MTFTCSHVSCSVLWQLEHVWPRRGARRRQGWAVIPDALDPLSWDSTAHPWCLQALDSKLPFEPAPPRRAEGSLCPTRIFWPREGVLLFPVASPHPLPFLLTVLRNSGEPQEACPGHCLLSSASEPPAPRKHANHLLSKLEETFRAT